MKAQNGNERLTARRWHVVRNLSDVGDELAEKSILVLGQLPFPVRPLVTKWRAKITKLTIVTDLAVELVIERHFVEGWQITSTFFGEDVLRAQWDFVMAQGHIKDSTMLGQAASEILEFSKLEVQADEVLVLPPGTNWLWPVIGLPIDEAVSAESNLVRA
jgi:hypothetical protein